MSARGTAGQRARQGLWAVGAGGTTGALASSDTAGEPALVVAAALAVVLATGWAVGRRRRARAAPPAPISARGLRTFLAVAALVITGHLAVGAALTGGLVGVDPLLVAVLAGAGGALAGPLGTAASLRFRREDERLLRERHPAAQVVRTRLVDDGSLHLARWAKAVGALLPAQLDDDLLLVALPDGLELWTSRWPRRDPRKVALLPRDDVALHREPAPGSFGGSWLVLTLRGPAASSHARSVPRERTAHPVRLLVYDGSAPVTRAEAVDAAVARLAG